MEDYFYFNVPIHSSCKYFMTLMEVINKLYI